MYFFSSVSCLVFTLWVTWSCFRRMSILVGALFLWLGWGVFGGSLRDGHWWGGYWREYKHCRLHCPYKRKLWNKSTDKYYVGSFWPNWTPKGIVGTPSIIKNIITDSVTGYISTISYLQNLFPVSSFVLNYMFYGTLIWPQCSSFYS